MDLHLDGLRAVVTGAISELSLAIAHRLAAEGTRLLLVTESHEGLDRTATAARPKEAPATLALDLADPDAAATVADVARRELGGVDILVNAVRATFEDDHDAAMLLEFTLPRLLIQELLPELRKSGNGRVINLIRSDEPESASALLAASAALRVWSKGFSREVGADGVTVNCVVPQGSESGVDPEDVSALVTMLASPRSSYVTGEVLHVDGGQRRHV